jgi:hypothetical protein
MKTKLQIEEHAGQNNVVLKANGRNVVLAIEGRDSYYPALAALSEEYAVLTAVAEAADRLQDVFAATDRANAGLRDFAICDLQNALKQVRRTLAAVRSGKAVAS